MPATPPPPPGLGRAAATVPASRASVSSESAAAPAPTTSAASPAVASAAPAGAVTVAFAPGSAALPADADAVLKSLLAKRGSAAIAVTGHGDATSSAPDAQATALTLGLQRAQAVASALTAQGVPANAVQVGAQAGGRGATLRLLQ
jgi:outer membrane protein OmpA-like peptidoglycan-associated protein